MSAIHGSSGITVAGKNPYEGITGVTVGGYKSLKNLTPITIAPLTIIAGANSSGKSSILQPLLLIKQTLEASYDPGSLLINGPNVKFTEADQLFTANQPHAGRTISVGFKCGQSNTTTLKFQKALNTPFEIVEQTTSDGKIKATVKPGMTDAEIRKDLRVIADRFLNFFGTPSKPRRIAGKFRVKADRCFLSVEYVRENLFSSPPSMSLGSTNELKRSVQRMIHVPGLRGNPERTYPVSAVGTNFPGTFERYVASIIASWQQNHDERLKQLGEDLKKVGLTWKVVAEKVNDTQVELKVGRLTKPAQGGARDLVSIADVGFGVSQTLPVLVALRVASRGQLVYIEQPEIHLHPTAQMRLADLIFAAVRRGVRVVAETHSAIFLLRVQTLIAEQRIAANDVAMHWFGRTVTGDTIVNSAAIEKDGSFGDWPSDFSEVLLKAQDEYLDAVNEVHDEGE